MLLATRELAGKYSTIPSSSLSTVTNIIKTMKVNKMLHPAKHVIMKFVE